MDVEDCGIVYQLKDPQSLPFLGKGIIWGELCKQHDL